MTTKIQVRRDLAANWTSVNPTLSAGEIGFETDTNKFKIGANNTAWNVLDYASGSVTVGSGLYTDAYGVTHVKVADSYGIAINFDGGVKAKVTSPLTINSYGEITVNMGQGVTFDNYGRLTLNVGSGLSFDQYGALTASGGGGGGGVDLASFSGLALDGYGRLTIALGSAKGENWWETNTSGLTLDAYGLSLDLATGAMDGIYSGLEVGQYGLRIKTSPYNMSSDKSNGVEVDNYGLKVAIGGANGQGEPHSGLKKTNYGLSVRLKEFFGMPMPSGLLLNEYGMEVFTGYDLSSGLTKNEYGLQVQTGDYSGLTKDYMEGLKIKPGIAYWMGNHPGVAIDNYGLHVELSPSWAGGKGLELNSYGLAVKLDGASITDDGYGLKVRVDSSSQLKADSMYGLAIDKTKPAEFTDSYGSSKTVFKSAWNSDTIAEPHLNLTLADSYTSMESFDAFVTIVDTTNPVAATQVAKVLGTLNDDGTISATEYASKGAQVGTVSFISGQYGSLICRITPNPGVASLRAFVKADVINDYNS